MKFYSDKFKAARQSRRYTIEQLSRDIGVTRATIWNWENDKRKPNETMVRKLAGILEVKTDVFSDIIPENSLSKEMLQKPVQSFLVNSGPGEGLRKKKFSELLEIITYFNSSLEQSSIVINAILDSMYSMCYIKDSGLQYIAANKSFIRNLGVNEDFQITGKRDDDFFTKSEAAKNTMLDKKVLHDGIPIMGQECFIPNSKKKKIGLITKQAIYDQNNNIIGVVCIIVDITNRREEEERRIMLENIINNINTGVCFYNPKKNKIVYNNKTHNSSFLLTDSKKHLCKEKIHPEDYKKYKNYYTKNIFPPTFDFRIILDNDEMKWLKINHSRVKYRGEDYFAFVEEDITNQRKNEEINSIVGESLGDVDLSLCIVDIETKKMVYTNKYREELYGYPVSAFLEKNNDFWLDTCIHPDDRDRLISYENEFEYPQKRYFRIIHSDGSIRWIEARNVKKVFTYNGRECLAFFDRDITEERDKESLNELYTMSLDMISEGVLIYEKKYGKCIFANKAILDRTGYSALDFTKKTNIWHIKSAIDGIYSEESNNQMILTRAGEKLPVKVDVSEKEINGQLYSVKTVKF